MSNIIIPTMASRNSLKKYAQDGYYHLYNRGVAKSEIFLEAQDYGIFLAYLKEYLSLPVPPTPEELRSMKYIYFRKNYSQEIELLAFCLMPNHFHLLLRQRKPRAIEFFMRSLLVRYASYFNKHHNRVGHLFQDVYKGILVDREEYLSWLSRYIHRNPLEIVGGVDGLASYPYSSYSAYIGMKTIRWINPQEILTEIHSYQEFVEGEEQTLPEDLISYILE